MGVKVKSKWNGPRVKAKMDRHMEQSLDIAALTVTQSIKDSFGDSGVVGKRSGATKQDRRKNTSKPWGPPNVDTSFLKSNVGWDKVRRFARRIGLSMRNSGDGQSVPYGIYLEFGTRNMLPRPWLRPGIYKNVPTIKRIMARKMR